MMVSSTGEKEEGALSFIEHLRELRTRLVRSLLILSVGVVLAYFFSETLFHWIRAPIEPYLPQGGLVFTNPTDKFMAHLQISLFAGMLFSCPLLLYEIWAFIAPGLYRQEKKYLVSFLGAGTFLFLMGVAFAYFMALPLGLEFLMTFGGEGALPMITIDSYLAFFSQICFLFGLAFELPLLIVLLGVAGLVSADFLRKKRRHAIFGLAVFAAILTPPDVLSMSLMLVPLLVLYEVSILIVRSFEKKKAASS